jgi:hypothetical protein
MEARSKADPDHSLNHQYQLKTHLWFDSKGSEFLFASTLTVVAGVHSDFDLRIETRVHIRRRINTSYRSRYFDTPVTLSFSSSIAIRISRTGYG